MTNPTVYIAGPDMFFRDTWPAHVARVESLCAPLGLTPVFPVPASPITGAGVTEDGSPAAARAIYQACFKALSEADMMLANFTPFRGDEPDSGTVFEAATAMAQGKIVVAYTRRPDPGKAMPPYIIHPDGAWLDDRGAVIERFGLPLNIMPACGVSDIITVQDAPDPLAVALRQLKAYWDALERYVTRAAEERAEAAHQDPSRGNPCDLVAHLRRQQAFSERTFGPGPRTRGVLDHIAKELAEIAEHPDDLEEWIDVVLLALDGAWRAGYTPEAIAAALTAKQAKNEERVWPDWRTAPPGQAIEHVRYQEHPAPPQQPCPCRHCEEQRGDTINGFPSAWSHMIVCPICGNKRCPHADNHTSPCAGSNTPGQVSGARREGDHDDSQ